MRYWDLQCQAHHLDNEDNRILGNRRKCTALKLMIIASFFIYIWDAIEIDLWMSKAKMNLHQEHWKNTSYRLWHKMQAQKGIVQWGPQLKGPCNRTYPEFCMDSHSLIAKRRISCWSVFCHVPHQPLTGRVHQSPLTNGGHVQSDVMIMNPGLLYYNGYF